MAVPEFVLALRAKVGHDPLPLAGVIAVVLDERGRVLMVRRSDTGEWALTTGCLEPAEQPADGAVREVLEETAVEVVVERLLSVEALDLSVGPNGDQVYWLAVGLRCRAVGGRARVNDDESVEVGWFEPDAVPPLPPHQARCLALAVAEDGATPGDPGRLALGLGEEAAVPGGLGEGAAVPGGLGGGAAVPGGLGGGAAVPGGLGESAAVPGGPGRSPLAVGEDAAGRGGPG